MLSSRDGSSLLVMCRVYHHSGYGYRADPAVALSHRYKKSGSGILRKPQLVEAHRPAPARRRVSGWGLRPADHCGWQQGTDSFYPGSLYPSGNRRCSRSQAAVCGALVQPCLLPGRFDCRSPSHSLGCKSKLSSGPGTRSQCGPGATSRPGLPAPDFPVVN